MPTFERRVRGDRTTVYRARVRLQGARAVTATFPRRLGGFSRPPAISGEGQLPVIPPGPADGSGGAAVATRRHAPAYLAEPDADADEARTIRPLQAAAVTYRTDYGPRADRPNGAEWPITGGSQR